jgi:two-component system phosphate regulon sensor histidine kinase PhoR
VIFAAIYLFIFAAMNHFNASSSKVIASLIALLLTFVSAFTMSLYFFNLLGQENEFVFLLFAILFIFTVSFISVYFIINQYILKRIEPIYKTIDAIKIPHKELFDNIDDKDIIKELRTDVMGWAKLKTREIEQLKSNEKFRKEFIGNVAHELKTPVFNIQGYVLTLLDGAMEDPELLSKYLRRTAKNVKRMVSLIKDVDTISRLEDGQVRLDYSRFNLCDLIGEVIELQEIKQDKYNIYIDFDELDCGEIFVKADREKMLEVINNLVVNSLKYGKNGGKTYITIAENLNKVFVSIKDDGIGISAEHLPHIFERFYRVDKSRSRERGGSGLGLAIVKHIIEAHHENIKVISKEAEGTEFVFTLQKAIENYSNDQI